MSIIARIVLTGICMFSRPEANQAPDAALFMDGRSDDHPHDVFLAINEEQYVISSELGILTFEHLVDAGGTKYAVVKLNDSLIKVKSDVQEHDVDASSLTVTKMSKVWPRIMFGPHSNAAPLRQVPRDSSLAHRVNARLTLPPGKLETRPPSPTQWEFDPNVFLHKHVMTQIAQEVTLTSTISDSLIKLAIYDFSDGTLTDFITVKPKNGTEIEMLLANVPRDDLFVSGSCANVNCTKTPDHICCTDHHFALYYNAYRRQPRTPPVPHQITTGGALTDNLAHLQRVGGANCGPTEP